MGDRLQRCQDDDGAARSTHTSLSYPGDRKRQLPLQEQLRPNPNEQEGESRPLDQNLRPKPYMKAGHFSAKIPGQLSAEINTESGLCPWTLRADRKSSRDWVASLPEYAAALAPGGARP